MSAGLINLILQSFLSAEKELKGLEIRTYSRNFRLKLPPPPPGGSTTFVIDLGVPERDTYLIWVAGSLEANEVDLPTDTTNQAAVRLEAGYLTELPITYIATDETADAGNKAIAGFPVFVKISRGTHARITVHYSTDIDQINLTLIFLQI